TGMSSSRAMSIRKRMLRTRASAPATRGRSFSWTSMTNRPVSPADICVAWAIGAAPPGSGRNLRMLGAGVGPVKEPEDLPGVGVVGQLLGLELPLVGQRVQLQRHVDRLLGAAVGAGGHLEHQPLGPGLRGPVQQAEHLALPQRLDGALGERRV